MDGSRNERARARACSLLAQIASLPNDVEVQRLRELSVDYISEAEKAGRNGANDLEPSEQVSAALDQIARDYFARATKRSKRSSQRLR